MYIPREPFKAIPRLFDRVYCEIVATYLRSALVITSGTNCSVFTSDLDCTRISVQVSVEKVKIPNAGVGDSVIFNKIRFKSINSQRNMYSDSVVPIKTETFSGVAAKRPISECIKKVLRRAYSEKRLTVGLLPAIQYLSKNSTGALFCFTVEAPPGDSATHMQEVLLRAFCEENDIYVIKVDSEAKLAKILGRCQTTDYSCLLVHYPYADPYTDSQEFDMSALTDSERHLVEYCEYSWDYAQTPVIKLPEK